MKQFLLLAALAVLSLGFYASHAAADNHGAAAQAQFDKPNYYAVKFHSDNCGSCRIMAPEIAKARGEGGLNDSNVLFVTMDYTNKSTIAQSKLHAAALGIDGYVKSKGAKTGYMMLIDSNAQELAKFTKADDAAKIASVIAEQTQN